MKARAFRKAVCADEGNLLDLLTQVLGDGSIGYCVIGGQAVTRTPSPR